MNLKFLFPILLGLSLGACSSNTSVNFSSDKDINSVSAQPKSRNLSLSLRCNLVTKEPLVAIRSPVMLNKKFGFYTDEKYDYFYATIADDSYLFSPEDSKKILNAIDGSNTLEITTSFENKAKFDLTDLKTALNNHLKECI